jgi:biopolymer transport protein ExbD
MPIKKPEPHLGHGIGLKTIKKAMGHGKKSVYATLNLTPMIDMFVMIVIFLLMTFSASGEIIMVSKDIKLPDATQFAELERSNVIAITSPEGDTRAGVVTLDGREVVSVRELVESESPDWKIPRLTEDLETNKHNCKLLHPDDADTMCTFVIVQSDKKVEFKALKKIMYSAGLAGYSNISFAVKEKGGGPAAGGGKP